MSSSTTTVRTRTASRHGYRKRSSHSVSLSSRSRTSIPKRERAATCDLLLSNMPDIAISASTSIPIVTSEPVLTSTLAPPMSGPTLSSGAIALMQRRKVPPPAPFKCLLPLLPLHEGATLDQQEKHGILYPVTWVPIYRDSPKNVHALHILVYGEAGIPEVLQDIYTVYGTKPSRKSSILSGIRERILQWAGHVLQTYGTRWWSMLSTPPRNRNTKQTSHAMDSQQPVAKRIKREDSKSETLPSVMDLEACSALRLQKIQVFLQPPHLREALDSIVSISSCPQYYQGPLEREMEKIKVRDNVATIHSRILSMVKPGAVILHLPFTSPSKYAAIDSAYRAISKIFELKDNQAFEVDPLTHISPFQREFLGPIMDHRTTVKSITKSCTAARTILHRMLREINLSAARLEELLQNTRSQSSAPK